MPTATMTPLLRHLHKLAGADERLSDAELLERFCRDQDAHAFKLLVQRHGPMVLGICRRALGASPDCEDAFQATFLVLVRKAKRMRQPELLGNWLFGVARRIALRARSRSMRESLRRRPLDDQFIAHDSNSNRNDGMSEVIDAAVARLPAKYRAPVVLCYLQGHSQADTAARLGCAVSTISTRIARAKARLRAHLVRQGMPAASAMPMARLGPDLLTAPVPTHLALAARTAASALAAGSGAGTIPVSILALTKGIGDTMIWHSWKLMGAALCAIAVGGTGVSIGWMPGGAEIGQSKAVIAPPSADSVHRVESLPNDDPTKPSEDADRPSAAIKSENFMVTAFGEREARLIAIAAEELRRKLAIQWLGGELAAWPKRCPITARLEDGGSGGATTFNYDFKGGVDIVCMKLNGSLAKILGDALPHEVMHTVLATHYAKPLPRWADEGIAVMAGGPEESAKHEAVLDGLMQKSKHVPLRRLFAVKEYNEVPNVNLVYAQGMSVVRFLVDRKDKPTFLKFLDRGMSTDWTTAAKDFYDFESIEAMEAAWLTDLIERRKGGDAQPVREPTATSIDRKPAEMSPPPFENQAQVVRAVIDDEGRLVVKALASKPGIKPGPNSGNPMPPPPDSPRQEIVRRFSILDVRGCLVKNHRLDEVELRRFADLLRAERAVIVTYADAPREELENYLLIAQDDTIVLLLPRPRVPTLGGP